MIAAAPISREEALRLAAKLCPPRPKDEEPTAARLVLQALRQGHNTYAAISKVTGLTPAHTNLTLTRLRKRGRVIVAAERNRGVHPTIWGIPATKP